MGNETTYSDKTARLLKANLPAFLGVAHLFRVEPPLAGHEYVVVSALETAQHDPKAPGGTRMGVETYIFGADQTGRLTGDPELPGSTKGTLDHREALLSAGYEVTA